jgi:hypothetical protein
MPAHQIRAVNARLKAIPPHKTITSKRDSDDGVAMAEFMLILSIDIFK